MNKKIILPIVAVFILIIAAFYGSSLYIVENDFTIMDTGSEPITHWDGTAYGDVWTAAQQIQIPDQDGNSVYIDEIVFRHLEIEGDGSSSDYNVHYKVGMCTGSEPSFYPSDWMENVNGVKYFSGTRTGPDGDMFRIDYYQDYEVTPGQNYWICCQLKADPNCKGIFNYCDENSYGGTNYNCWSRGLINMDPQSHDMLAEVYAYYTTEEEDVVADFDWTPNPGIKSESISFNAEPYTTGGESPLMYAWDWNNDGTLDTPYGTSSSAYHLWTTTGTKQVTLSVMDINGFEDNVTKSITIIEPSDTPPVADFYASNYYPEVGESVQFTDDSHDTDGTITSYHWNFGDGDTTTTKNPSHTFTYSDTFNVELIVTDDDNNEDTVTKQIVVSSDPNPPSTGDITCISKDNNGNYVKDVDVTLSEDGYVPSSGTGNTGSDSHYTFSNLDTSGTYTVTFSKNGVTDTVSGLTPPATATSSLDIGPSPGQYTLTFRVLSDDNTPIQEAKVTCEDSNSAIVGTDYTNTDGYSTFSNLGNGEYTLTVEKDDYTTAHKTVIISNGDTSSYVQLSEGSVWDSAEGLELMPLIISLIIAIVGIIIALLLPVDIKFKIVIALICVIVAIFLYIIIALPEVIGLA